MTKKPANDDNGERVDSATVTVKGVSVNIEDAMDLISKHISHYAGAVTSSTHDLARLAVSGIVTFNDDHTITWRTGHLEHIANLFTGDPATTERDYADDLAVARAYSREQWEALIKHE